MSGSDSDSHMLVERLYTLDARLLSRDTGLDDALSKDDGRLGINGVGGSGLCKSGGGVRLTKLLKDGIDCSMPLKEGEGEVAALRAGGRLMVPEGRGLGIFQPCVSP